MTQRSDTERLEWLDRQPKAESIFEGLYRLAFSVPYIGPMEHVRDAIDATMDAETP